MMENIMKITIDEPRGMQHELRAKRRAAKKRNPIPPPRFLGTAPVSPRYPDPSIPAFKRTSVRYDL
jgi:hypothetical protein